MTKAIRFLFKKPPADKSKARRAAILNPVRVTVQEILDEHLAMNLAS